MPTSKTPAPASKKTAAKASAKAPGAATAVQSEPSQVAATAAPAQAGEGAGRYLARAANTGVSAIVDPYGRVVQATPLFEETVSVGEVRFLDGTTLYVRIGDVVPWAGLVVAIGLWVLSARGRRRSTSTPPPPSGDPRAVDRS